MSESASASSQEWITFAQALTYLQERFSRMGLKTGPSKAALLRWFNRGYIKTHRHRFHSLWFTTYDWLDEAIMWKRIPPRRGRPPIAKVVEREDYIATQENLL